MTTSQELLRAVDLFEIQNFRDETTVMKENFMSNVGEPMSTLKRKPQPIHQDVIIHRY